MGKGFYPRGKGFTCGERILPAGKGIKFLRGKGFTLGERGKGFTRRERVYHQVILFNVSLKLTSLYCV